jgi:hypothetical protein
LWRGPAPVPGAHRFIPKTPALHPQNPCLPCAVYPLVERTEGHRRQEARAGRRWLAPGGRRFGVGTLRRSGSLLVERVSGPFSLCWSEHVGIQELAFHPQNLASTYDPWTTRFESGLALRGPPRRRTAGTVLAKAASARGRRMTALRPARAKDDCAISRSSGKPGTGLVPTRANSRRSRGRPTVESIPGT